MGLLNEVTQVISRQLNVNIRKPVSYTHLIKIIKSKLNPALEIEGFLLTMYDSRLRQANQLYDEVKRHVQELVFNTVSQRNVKLSEAPVSYTHRDVYKRQGRSCRAVVR